MLLNKLQKLGIAAKYDSCGGSKIKSGREWGVPYEYQDFIHNCTQTSENVFLGGMRRRKYKAEKGKKLYEQNNVAEKDKKELREGMKGFLGVRKGQNKRLNKANKCLLFKVLQDNTCMHDCKYCINNSCKKRKAETLEAKELANSFDFLRKEGLATGLFLSSAVHGNAEKSTEKMIESVKLVRQRGYKGYIHSKVLPETPLHLVEELALYSNRLSLNLEASTKTGFEELTSTKDYKNDILRKIRKLDTLKKKSDKLGKRSCWFWDTKEIEEGKDLRFSSFTTQIILGANEETDKDIVERMSSLYSESELYRTYFSAFSPVEGSPLEKRFAQNPKREHSLYEVDFLFRVYGFDKKIIEKGLNDSDNFSFGHDVKQSIASSMPELFPLDPNTATEKELLLVPGLGPKSVDKILQVREEKKIREIEDLAKEGIRVKKSQKFINLEGKQTNLFSF
jgi:predicted DNA-binding helix-hairpin-helix protein